MEQNKPYHPSDRDYEDGGYLNTCGGCSNVFLGPKRQPTCAVCKAVWDALTPEEQAAKNEAFLASQNLPYKPGSGPIFTADVECSKWPRCGCPHLFECVGGS